MAPETRASLLAEHDELRRLSARLRAVRTAPGAPREALAQALDLLFAVLFQHETEEAQVLPSRLRKANGGARRLELLEGEHLTLQSLVKDVKLVRSHPELYNAEHLGRLSERLETALEAHLAFEEKHVYPLLG